MGTVNGLKDGADKGEGEEIVDEGEAEAAGVLKVLRRRRKLVWSRFGLSMA